MRLHVANSYVLSVSVLIAELVRQSQENATQDKHSGDDDDGCDGERRAVSRVSLNALALFLVDELQQPMADAAVDDDARFTALASLLRRLQRRVDHAEDFLALSSVLVGILATVDSPDAVSNVVDRVAECVAPRGTTGGDGDSTSSLLTRQSPLGVFVRKFLLAVNRLLFDGLSRLFDDVVQYVAQFQEDEARARAAVAAEGDPSASEDASVVSDAAESGSASEDESMEMDVEASPTSESSRRSAEFLWQGGAGDGLLLSPIPARVSGVGLTGFAPIAQSSQSSTESPPQPPATSTTPPPLAVAVSTEPLDVSVWTHDQMNFVLHDMMRAIERERTATGDTRTNDDGDLLSAQLRRVTETDTSSASVLFVKYLDFLHRRDYQGALDSLHQYHDIALSSAKISAPVSSPESVDANGNPTFGASGSSAGGMHVHGTGIQYAALNLAGLQILFDHHQAAYESVQEAIRVAQHYGDHVCVAFALSWLIRVYLKLGRSKEQVLGLLRSCIERAKELRLPSLETLASLTQIESDILRGPSTDRFGSSQDHQGVHFLPAVYASQAPSPRPLHIWHRLQEIVRSVNAVPSTMSTSSGGAGAGVRGTFGGVQPQLTAAQQGSSNLQPAQTESGIRWIKSVDSVLDHMWRLSGKLFLSSAVSWQVLGQRTLGAMFDRIHFLCFQDAASACEVALSVCSLATCHLGDEDVGGANIYARGLSFLADTIDDVANGELIYHAPVQRKLNGLFFLWALRCGQFLRAKAHSELLLELSPAHKDLPAHIEALVAKAVLLNETGDFSGSLALLGAVEKICIDHELAYLHARTLLVTAQVLHGAARAEAPFSALNAALEVARICQLQQYDVLLAEVHLVLAEIYVSMGTLDRADSLLEAQMPLVMEHGDVNVRGECLLLLAKSALASNDDTRKMPSGGSSSYQRALDLLQRSSVMFAASQNLKRLKEISYLRAMVLNHLFIQPFAERASDKSEHAELRERAAEEFLELEERVERAKFKPIEPFFDLEFTGNIRKVIYHRMHGG